MKDRLRILVAYDGSECANGMLADLKRAGLPRKAEVHVLSVYAEWLPVPDSLGMLQTAFNKAVSAEERETQAIAKRARMILLSAFPDWEVHAKACAGSPARAILQYADELRPDLLVVGSHGRSAFGRLFLGSVSQKILHAAHGSVRIARGHAAEPSGPIRLIVGMDGSPGAEAAVKAVTRRHWPRGSEARLVNGSPILPRVADEISVAQITAWSATERARVEEFIKLATGKLKGANLVVSTKVKDLDARQLLISEAEAWEADCIFVGARGMGAVERFVLGSVSSSVAARARCSVEVVREP